MEGAIICPHCNVAIPDSLSTRVTRTPSMNHDKGGDIRGTVYYDASTLELTYYKCPMCGKYTVYVRGIGNAVCEYEERQIIPLSCAKNYPDYIPSAIRNDYEEAYSILQLSPKSAATLARRCLQGMIRDYWNVNGNSLFDEINKIEHMIPSGQWRAIDGLRRLGNIGAHMEKDINTIVDIDPDEATKLIKLIELLIEQWYVARHEQEALYDSVVTIDEMKQEQRRK